jgi:hypothetical protein
LLARRRHFLEWRPRFPTGPEFNSCTQPRLLLEKAYNQFFVVPQLSADLLRYLFKRKIFGQQIHDRDLQYLKANLLQP